MAPGSGNRRPKRRANPEDKSFTVSIRLNPRKEAHRWARDYLAAFDAEQEQLPEDERQYRGDLVVAALMAYDGQQQTEPTVIASAQDVVAIRDIVQYILDQVQQGGLPVANGKRKPKVKPATVSPSMQATINRYIDNGFTGDDQLDED